MNATARKCSILANLLSRNMPKYFSQQAFVNRAEFILYPPCSSLAIRLFHSRQQSREGRVWPVASSNSRVSLAHFSSQKDGVDNRRKESGGDDYPPELTVEEDMKKLGLFARFKKMYKEYWYVLLPAHLVTSAVWFGSFYYLSTRLV